MRKTIMTSFVITLLVLTLITVTACEQVEREWGLEGMPENQSISLTPSRSEIPDPQAESPTLLVDQEDTNSILNTVTPDINKIVWSRDLLPLLLLENVNLTKAIVPTWSPTENQLLFDCQSESSNLTVVMAPEFQSKVLSTSSGCQQSAWSSDGRMVAYVDQNNSLQISQVNGSISNPISKIGSFRYPIDFQWIDSSHLIVSDYQGGGHQKYSLIEILSGKKDEIASIPGGMMAPYHSSYLPVTSEIDVADQRMIVISNQFPASEETIPMYTASGRYRLFPTYQSVSLEQAWTAYNDWLSGTNQLLVAWKHYKKPDLEVQQEALLFWDLTMNQIKIAAPNGIEGLLSPDGHYLAYLTRGPALLDKQNEPINSDKVEKFTLYGPFPNVPTYLQVLNLIGGKIFISVPAEEMNFSPKSTYFSFLANGNLPPNTVLDINGTQTAEGSNIYIIGLKDEKLVLSIDHANVLPVWSPKEDKLLYEDDSGVITLFEIDNRKPTKLLQLPKNEIARELSWSYDGQYFAITLYIEENGISTSKIAIYKSPN